MIKHKQRVFPSLVRVKKGREKRKRREEFSIRQENNSLKCLITNVINFGSSITPVI